MIQFLDVTKRYPRKTVLSSVTFSLPDTGMFVLEGKNGAGKTTILNLISGADFPTSGTVRVYGRDVTRKSASLIQEAYVRTVYQDFIFPQKLSVRECVLFPYDRKDESEALRLLEEVGLERLKDNAVETISAGERKRLMLAVLMYGKPEILLVDEALAQLDVPTAVEMIRLLRTLSERILVLITTNRSDLKPYFEQDRKFMVADGTVVSQGEMIVEKATDTASSMRREKKATELFFHHLKKNAVSFVGMMVLSLLFCCISAFGLSTTFSSSGEMSEKETIAYVLKNMSVGRFDLKRTYDPKEDALHEREDTFWYDPSVEVSRVEMTNELLFSGVVYERPGYVSTYPLTSGRYPENDAELVIPDRDLPSDAFSRIQNVTGYTVVGTYRPEISCNEELFGLMAGRGIIELDYGYWNAFSVADQKASAIRYNKTQGLSFSSLKKYTAVLSFFISHTDEDMLIDRGTFYNVFHPLGMAVTFIGFAFEMTIVYYFYRLQKVSLQTERLLGILPKKLSVALLLQFLFLFVLPWAVSWGLTPLWGKIQSELLFSNLIGTAPQIARVNGTWFLLQAGLLLLLFLAHWCMHRRLLRGTIGELLKDKRTHE